MRNPVPPTPRSPRYECEPPLKKSTCPGAGRRLSADSGSGTITRSGSGCRRKAGSIHEACNSTVMQNPIIHPEAAKLLDLVSRIANALKSINNRLERPWDGQHWIWVKGRLGELDRPINKRGTPRL